MFTVIFTTLEKLIIIIIFNQKYTKNVTREILLIFKLWWYLIKPVLKVALERVSNISNTGASVRIQSKIYDGALSSQKR